MYPIEIKFRDFPKSDFVYNNIFDHAEKLGQFYPKIISCLVMVSAPHRHHLKGKIYQVSIRIHVPGKEIIVNRDGEKNSAHEDVYVAVRDAFDAAVRRIEDYARRRRGVEKFHPATA